MHPQNLKTLRHLLYAGGWRQLVAMLARDLRREGLRFAEGRGKDGISGKDGGRLCG